MKLPSLFKEYFENRGEKRFWVTTIDERLLYVYPIAIWREKEARLAAATETEELNEAAESIAFTANHYGAECSMDAEGRMLVSQELRTDLKLADAPVWLQFLDGKVIGYNEEQYSAQRQASRKDLDSKVRMAKTKRLV